MMLAPSGDRAVPASLDCLIFVLRKLSQWLRCRRLEQHFHVDQCYCNPWTDAKKPGEDVMDSPSDVFLGWQSC